MTGLRGLLRRARRRDLRRRAPRAPAHAVRERAGRRVRARAMRAGSSHRAGYDPPVAADDTQAAFAEAAAADGIVLERVVRLALRAGARRARAGGEGAARPGAGRAGEGGARGAGGDLRPPPGRRLRPARRAREPPAPGRPGARTVGDRGRGRRPGALHLVPAARARALPGRRAPVGFDLAEYEELCRSWRADERRARPRPRRPRGSASAASSGSAPTTTRCCDLATPAMGHPPVIRIAALDGDGAGRLRAGVRGGPPSHRLISPAASPGAPAGRPASFTATLTVRQRPQRTRTRLVICTGVHRGGEHVAALDADVVVGAVAVEHGPVRVLLDRGAAVAGHLALARLPHRDRAMERPSQRAELAGEVRDQRVEHPRPPRPRPSRPPCR